MSTEACMDGLQSQTPNPRGAVLPGGSNYVEVALARLFGGEAAAQRIGDDMSA